MTAPNGGALRYVNDEIIKKKTFMQVHAYIKIIYIYTVIYTPSTYIIIQYCFLFSGVLLQFKAASKDLTPSNRL